MAFQDELTAVLLERFPGARLVEFGTVPQIGKVGGVVEWAGFDEMDQLDRQTMLWDALKLHFDRDQLRGVSMILTFSPWELHAMEEG